MASARTEEADSAATSDDARAPEGAVASTAPPSVIAASGAADSPAEAVVSSAPDAEVAVPASDASRAAFCAAAFSSSSIRFGRRLGIFGGTWPTGWSFIPPSRLYGRDDSPRDTRRRASRTRQKSYARAPTPAQPTCSGQRGGYRRIDVEHRRTRRRAHCSPRAHALGA